MAKESDQTWETALAIARDQLAEEDRKVSEAQIVLQNAVAARDAAFAVYQRLEMRANQQVKEQGND